MTDGPADVELRLGQSAVAALAPSHSRQPTRESRNLQQLSYLCRIVRRQLGLLSIPGSQVDRHRIELAAWLKGDADLMIADRPLRLHAALRRGEDAWARHLKGQQIGQDATRTFEHKRIGPRTLSVKPSGV